MAASEPALDDTMERIARLEAENRMLREEIRVSRQAAEITAGLVVEQFEKSEQFLARLQAAGERLRESNIELESANERLRELDRLKSGFLSSVSHELRTPLTSIRGFAHLIAREFDRTFARPAQGDPKLAKKAHRLRENVAVIEAETQRLTRLINEVLDLSKIESGRVDWNDAPVAPADLIRRAADAARGQFELRPQVRLEIGSTADLPMLTADRDRLIQVLVNLLNNAAKFTEHGTVRLSAYAETIDGEWVCFEIADTGCGFPPEQAEAIFDKFHQVDHGDTLVDKPTGTGLGLPICREIVVRHGGRIWAESTPGSGSTFRFTLPAGPKTIKKQATELAS